MELLDLEARRVANKAIPIMQGQVGATARCCDQGSIIIKVPSQTQPAKKHKTIDSQNQLALQGDLRPVKPRAKCKTLIVPSPPPSSPSRSRTHPSSCVCHPCVPPESRRCSHSLPGIAISNRTPSLVCAVIKENEQKSTSVAATVADNANHQSRSVSPIYIPMSRIRTTAAQPSGRSRVPVHRFPRPVVGHLVEPKRLLVVSVGVKLNPVRLRLDGI